MNAGAVLLCLALHGHRNVRYVATENIVALHAQEWSQTQDLGPSEQRVKNYT